MLVLILKSINIKDLFQKGFPNYENESEEGKNDKQFEKIKDLFKSIKFHLRIFITLMIKLIFLSK